MSKKTEENWVDDEQTHDFDFRHFLRDTIVLLGGKIEIADLLTKSLDYRIDDSDIAMLRQYNIDLLEQVKARLADANKIKVKSVE